MVYHSLDNLQGEGVYLDLSLPHHPLHQFIHLLQLPSQILLNRHPQLAQVHPAEGRRRWVIGQAYNCDYVYRTYSKIDMITIILTKKQTNGGRNRYPIQKQPQQL